MNTTPITKVSEPVSVKRRRRASTRFTAIDFFRALDRYFVDEHGVGIVTRTMLQIEAEKNSGMMSTPTL